MKYVDWVESVLPATVEAFETGNGWSTDEAAVLAVLGFEPDSHGEAIWDALRDLKRFGLVELGSRNDIRISQEARKIRVTSLRTTWPGIHETWLDDRQAQFLAKLCELSEQRAEDSASLAEVNGDEVLSAIGETPERGASVAVINALRSIGLVDASGMTLGNFPAFPTYSGIVLATEKAATEGQVLVAGLLDDWETSNTEFKRQLRLTTKDEKAEFIRDVLALANTQVSGDRYLITGFDDKSRDFTTSADPKVTQDTIENLLNEYTKPPVTIQYRTFPEQNGTGDIGVLTVVRDRTKVPFRVARRLAGAKKVIEEGDVYVRHGSHVAMASDEEIADLEEEARRARGDA
jgi:hypothetical protein